jgi:hypothetical protein
VAKKDNTVPKIVVVEEGGDKGEIEGRPDPRFKLRTGQMVTRLGIKAVATELPQLLSTDMLFDIPPESHANLIATLLDFLRDFRYAVTDFKGPRDNLDLDKYNLNMARTSTFSTRVKESTDKRRVLNLIVSSRYPQEILALANEDPDRPEFRNIPERPWLWRGGPFNQPVIIVVCRDLPLEEPYYEWLIFAPPDSQKWKTFAKMMLQEKRQDILEELVILHPKEMNAMSFELNTHDQKVAHALERDALEALVPIVVENFSPKEFRDILTSTLPREKLAEVVATEEIISAIPPEQMLNALTPEQKISSVTPEQMLNALTPEQMDALRKKLVETSPTQTQDEEKPEKAG